MIRPSRAFYTMPQHLASRAAIVRVLGHFLGILAASNDA